jgi:Flp pilus assembly protein TadB
MTTTTLVFALLGAGVGAGLNLIILSRRSRPPHSRGHRRRWWRLREQHAIRTTAVMGAGTVGGVLTGWIVGAGLITAAVWFLPKLLGRHGGHATQRGKVEAIAAWTEMLRDTLAAAAGLEQAILASAPVAPAAIQHEVVALATRLENGDLLEPSLRRFADELADPTSDLVVAALVLAATQQARNLGELLGSLAATARERAAMRMRVDASRTRTRTSVRIIVGTTVGFVGLLTLANREYLAAFDTPTGQLVLLTIGALFAAGFAWLSRIAEETPPARLFAQSYNKDLG